LRPVAGGKRWRLKVKRLSAHRGGKKKKEGVLIVSALRLREDRKLRPGSSPHAKKKGPPATKSFTGGGEKKEVLVPLKTPTGRSKKKEKRKKKGLCLC